MPRLFSSEFAPLSKFYPQAATVSVSESEKGIATAAGDLARFAKELAEAACNHGTPASAAAAATIARAASLLRHARLVIVGDARPLTFGTGRGAEVDTTTTQVHRFPPRAWRRSIMAKTPRLIIHLHLHLPGPWPTSRTRWPTAWSATVMHVAPRARTTRSLPLLGSRAYLEGRPCQGGSLSQTRTSSCLMTIPQRTRGPGLALQWLAGD